MWAGGGIVSAEVLLAFNRWWICELLNAVLRPMFCRYKKAERAGDAARFDRCELLFLRMLNACDCYPFCVEVGQGLWILDEPSEEYYGEEGLS
jgi:hypothetical protein